jgi:lipopolysaccharide export system protein LptA
MRRTRWLFLFAIIFIVVAVGATYLTRKGNLARDAPARPKPLARNFDGSFSKWCYSDQKGTTQHVHLCAETMKESAGSTGFDLDGVDLKLYNKEGTQYDLVKTQKALCDPNAKTLYADGDVEITLNCGAHNEAVCVPVEGTHGRIVKIHSSGVKFDTQSGKATTDRPMRFDFDQGGGTAVGADYDPQTRELHMKAQISLDWRGKKVDSVPMHIESGEAFYRERDSKVILIPWSKLQRDTLRLEGKMSVVTLDKGEVRLAEIEAGHGVKEDPDRKVEFGADGMTMNFADGMLVTKISGDRNAHLISSTDAARTTVTGDRMEMGFETSGKESTLSTAVAVGKSMAENVPIAKPGTQPGDTRILHSEVIHLKMRSGGQEIESVETDGAATMDFLPNRPGLPKRVMTGDKVWIKYGEDNRIESFRSVNVTTRTEKPGEKGKPVPPPGFTTSKEMLAMFDPATSDMSHLDQKNDFKYDEGDRHARADHATLDQKTDMMTLDKGARVWDSTGSAAADHIVMNQKSGDFTADGHVASTRMPDPKGNSSAMLNTDEIMQARAQKMVSTDSNLKIHYEGNAVAWQGSNRVEAERLDIDRDAGIMEADGKVVSYFVDKDKSDRNDKNDKKSDGKTKAKAAPKPSTATPIFTVVHAPHLTYTEDTRIAIYKGGVLLQRPDLTVTGQQIQAFLNDADADSSLNKTVADGAVKIVSTAHAKVRTGTSEHSEYYADDGKVILTGGRPLLVDSKEGKTQQDELTWWANDDRLLSNGQPTSQVKSVVRKK